MKKLEKKFKSLADRLGTLTTDLPKAGEYGITPTVQHSIGYWYKVLDAKKGIGSQLEVLMLAKGVDFDKDLEACQTTCPWPIQKTKCLGNTRIVCGVMFEGQPWIRVPKLIGRLKVGE